MLTVDHEYLVESEILLISSYKKNFMPLDGVSVTVYVCIRSCSGRRGLCSKHLYCVAVVLHCCFVLHI